MIFGMLDRHFFSLAMLVWATLLFISGTVEFSLGTILAALAATSVVPIALAAVYRQRRGAL